MFKWVYGNPGAFLVGIRDVMNVSTCHFGWILIGCQCFYRSSNRSESDPNDIVHHYRCRYSCSVDAAKHLSLERFLKLYFYSYIYSYSSWCGRPFILCRLCNKIKFVQCLIRF